ncbi:MAG: glycoside hydrolase family 2 protein [Candidatus Aminicenantes bacterium]
MSAGVFALVAAVVGPAYPRPSGEAPRSAVIHLSLDGDWEFRQAGKTAWNKATVPGCVHTDLMSAGLIPDPFFRMNELEVRWIEKQGWVYRRAFEAGEGVTGGERVELVAEGLDTFARIFLNGRRVGETENMFRTWRFDIRPFLKRGRNVIQIEFDSPVEREKALASRASHKLPGEAPHVRKAPYHFGWDWGPRLVTSGIWRPIRIEAWSGARFRDMEIVQESLGREAARLRVRARVDATGPATAELEIYVDGVKAIGAARSVALGPGGTWLETAVQIDQPRLWWPAGLGEQNLYRLEVRLVRDGQALDADARRIGLRTLALEQRPDRWGRSFQFSVNGLPFFAKGANWIPADSFPSRVTREKYGRLLGSAVEAHMNMLRVWGGGIYESADFYDLCDELGIVVWQDFMFACAMFPGDEGFLANVAEEAAEVVKRLRHHPSIGLWCGNNECEEGWFHWGWKERLPASVWADYEKIFHGVLPAAVQAHDPGRAYWPSSPSSEKTGEPRSERSGDMHTWGVWHGQEPFEEYRRKFHRFQSEFGFQSFPLIETVETFTEPGDRNLTSPVMEHHQKHPEGNRLILHYMLDEYRMPEDFESLLWLSQVQQAEGMRIAAEHFRSQRPRVMGSLYWQFQDCWPAASWAGIDSTGAWKALHYYARRFYAPVLVTAAAAGPDLVVSSVSDLRATRDAVFEWFTATYEGRRIAGGTFTVKLEPQEAKDILKMSLEALRRKQAPERVYFYCELRDKRDKSEVLSSSVHHFSRLKSVELPEAEIEWSVSREGGALAVGLETDRFAKAVHLRAPGVAGRFLDNFIDLVPGRPRRAVFLPDGEVAPETLAAALKLRSLRNSY